jgi:hypothetical protein
MRRQLFVGIIAGCAIAALVLVTVRASRENRLRGECKRRGFRLQKSRRPDRPRLYEIVDPVTNAEIYGVSVKVTLDKVEEFLESKAAIEIANDMRRFR